MIVVAEAYARFVRTLGRDDVAPGAQALLSAAEEIVYAHFAERLDRNEIRVVVRVEEGSTRIWVTISTVIVVLTTCTATSDRASTTSSTMRSGSAAR